MTDQCQIVQQDPQPALSVRTRTNVNDLPQFFGAAWGAIMQYLGEVGGSPAGVPYAVYHTLDMNDLDVEAGIAVNGQFPGKDQVKPSEIPGGRAATCMHVGSYEGLPQAYEVLTRFVNEQGAEPTGIAYEFYFNDPTQTPPEELQTLIMFPLT